MTSVRAIDIDNDWQFGKGKNDYRFDLNAIAQNIKTRLQSFLGDCFFAEQEGIDWFNLLGNKDKLQLNLAVSSVILNTEGVTLIQNYTLAIDQSRNSTLSYEILTVFGSSTNSFQLDLGALENA